MSKLTTEEARIWAEMITEELEADLRANGRVGTGPHALFCAFMDVMINDRDAVRAAQERAKARFLAAGYELE